MMNKLVRLTEEIITFHSDRPKDVGKKIQLEIKLPKGISIKSFVLHGIITGCESIRENGSGGYLLEMKICEISPLNQKILAAYIDFLERDRKLKKAKADFKNLQEAMTDLKKRFSQLADAVEQMRYNALGMLELIRKNTSDKTTIH